MQKKSGTPNRFGTPECSDFACPVQTISSGGGAENRISGGGSLGAGVFDVLETSVFFAVFLDESACYEILKLFVCTKAKHLFATADSIPSFQIFVNNLKKIVETKGFFVGKDNYQFVSDVIWHPSRESCSTCG